MFAKWCAVDQLRGQGSLKPTSRSSSAGSFCSILIHAVLFQRRVNWEAFESEKSNWQQIWKRVGAAMGGDCQPSTCFLPSKSEPRKVDREREREIEDIEMDTVYFSPSFFPVHWMFFHPKQKIEAKKQEEALPVHWHVTDSILLTLLLGQVFHNVIHQAPNWESAFTRDWKFRRSPGARRFANLEVASWERTSFPSLSFCSKLPPSVTCHAKLDFTVPRRHPAGQIPSPTSCMLMHVAHQHCQHPDVTVFVRTRKLSWVSSHFERWNLSCASSGCSGRWWASRRADVRCPDRKRVIYRFEKLCTVCKGGIALTCGVGSIAFSVMWQGGMSEAHTVIHIASTHGLSSQTCLLPERGLAAFVLCNINKSLYECMCIGKYIYLYYICQTCAMQIYWIATCIRIYIYIYTVFFSFFLQNIQAFFFQCSSSGL